MRSATHVRIATRGSALALAQARWVADQLGEAELIEASSDGEPGDKARFVRGVERALLEGRADVGVHSAKDLPAELPEGLAIPAVPAREDPADAWVGAVTEPSPSGEKAPSPLEGAFSLSDVPEGARVGTASLRRRAQLLAARPDLRVEELHGNVDTRLRRVAEGDFDAVVLALAGLKRLGKEGEVAFALPPSVGEISVEYRRKPRPHGHPRQPARPVGEIDPAIRGQSHPPAPVAMIPAAGQGALVLQVRAGDEKAHEAVASLNDDSAMAEVTAERAAVAKLGADCTTPIGVLARVDGGGGYLAHTDGYRLALEAFVGLPDGSEWIRDRIEVEIASGDGTAPGPAAADLYAAVSDPTAPHPAAAGTLLAERLLAAGARDLLDRAAT